MIILKSYQQNCQEEIVCVSCGKKSMWKMDHLCYYVDGDYGIDFLCGKCQRRKK